MPKSNTIPSKGAILFSWAIPGKLAKLLLMKVKKDLDESKIVGEYLILKIYYNNQLKNKFFSKILSNLFEVLKSKSRYFLSYAFINLI